VAAAGGVNHWPDVRFVTVTSYVAKRSAPAGDPMVSKAAAAAARTTDGLRIGSSLADLIDQVDPVNRPPSI
jgi:hypothetical protein